MNRMKTGKHWAIVWDEEAREFELQCPEGIDGESNTPLEARYLAAIFALMKTKDFLTGVMEWFDEDFGKWKRRKDDVRG